MTPERLLQRIRVTADGCWLFTGAINDSGYGVVRVGRSLWKAHRWSFVLAFGPLPATHDVNHLCHERDLSCIGLGSDCPHRRCIRPGHLEPLSIHENRHVAVAKRNERIRERYAA